MQLKDYGQARQITLFERGTVALQILTSDLDACPAEILSWLKSRWREENFLKYASENYGIDKICDYTARIETNTKIVITRPARPRPGRYTTPRRRWPLPNGTWPLLADPAITPAAKNTRLIPAAQDKITRARKNLAAAVTARGKIPAKLPASDIDPGAKVAVLRACCRGLQMVLRLLAHNASTGCRTSSTPTCATTRIPRDHPRDHHPQPGPHHHLYPRRNQRHSRPARAPHVARALALLISRSTPPRPPCPHPRPVSYHLAPPPGI